MEYVDAQTSNKREHHLPTLLSHKFRNPLSVIKWHTEMLLDGDIGQLSHEQQEYVESIQLGCQQMTAAFDDLLEHLSNNPPVEAKA